MEISLVEKNISSLEDGICVETNAAFVLHFALHLEEKTEGRKLKQKKNNDEAETLKATRNRARQERWTQADFFPFPHKEPFSFSWLIDWNKRGTDEFARHFPPFLKSTHLLGKRKVFSKEQQKQEQRDVSSVDPRSSCIKTAPRCEEKLYELKMRQMLQRNKIKTHRHDET